MEQEQKRLLIRGARILNPARGEDYIGNILISGPFSVMFVMTKPTSSM